MLRASPVDGSWALSEPTTTDLIKGTVANPLTHLEWSPTFAPEIAVFDSVGRVCIMNFPVSLNNPFVNRKWDTDAIDDMNVIVGCHWLPVAPNPQVSCAWKEDMAGTLTDYPRNRLMSCTAQQ